MVTAEGRASVKAPKWKEAELSISGVETLVSRVQGGMGSVRRMMRNQARKMSRDQVAECPKNHVRIWSFFLRPTGSDWRVLNRGMT